jgi:microcystin-dependent protein
MPITKTQGPVKTSEISVDRAQSTVESSANERLYDVLDLMGKAISDHLRISLYFLYSTNTLVWNGSGTLLVRSGETLGLKLALNPINSTETVINLKIMGVSNEMINGALPNAAGTSINLGSKGILCLELDRTILNSAVGSGGLVDITIDGSAGKRLVVYDDGSQPNLSVNASISNTLLVPLAYRVESTSSLAWVPTGIVWQGATTAYSGSFYFGETVPLGSVMSIAAPDHSLNGGITQPNLDLLAGPGWKVCDGTAISDVNSPWNGLNSPNYTDRYLRGNTTSGATGGSNTTTLTANEMISHTHVMNPDGLHSYHVPPGNWRFIKRSVSGEPARVMSNSDSTVGEPNIISTPQRAYDFAGTHWHTISSTGSGTAHNNQPRNFKVIYIMRVR